MYIYILFNVYVFWHSPFSQVIRLLLNSFMQIRVYMVYLTKSEHSFGFNTFQTIPYCNTYIFYRKLKKATNNVRTISIITRSIY